MDERRGRVAGGVVGGWGMGGGGGGSPLQSAL